MWLIGADISLGGPCAFGREGGWEGMCERLEGDEVTEQLKYWEKRRGGRRSHGVTLTALSHTSNLRTSILMYLDVCVRAICIHSEMVHLHMLEPERAHL